MNLAATTSATNLSIMSLPRVCEHCDVRHRDCCGVLRPARIPVSFTWRKLPTVRPQISATVYDIYSAAGTPRTELWAVQRIAHALCGIAALSSFRRAKVSPDLHLHGWVPAAITAAFVVRTACTSCKCTNIPKPQPLRLRTPKLLAATSTRPRTTNR